MIIVLSAIGSGASALVFTNIALEPANQHAHSDNTDHDQKSDSKQSTAPSENKATTGKHNDNMASSPANSGSDKQDHGTGDNSANHDGQNHESSNNPDNKQQESKESSERQNVKENHDENADKKQHNNDKNRSGNDNGNSNDSNKSKSDHSKNDSSQTNEVVGNDTRNPSDLSTGQIENVTVDFEDDPALASLIVCNPNLSFQTHDQIVHYPTECDPAHHEWIKSEGIDITSVDNQMLRTTWVSGTWHTGNVIEYVGQDKNENFKITFLYGPSSYFNAELTAVPNIAINNQPTYVTLKAFDSDGNILKIISENFTTVTNGVYTPGNVSISLPELRMSAVTIEVTQKPRYETFDSQIWLESVEYTRRILTPVPDTTPPAITVPLPWDKDRVVGYDIPNPIKVDYFDPLWMRAYDDVDGPVLLVCDPLSGSYFPVGDSIVHCTAKDSSNNTSTTSFLVGVSDLASRVVLPPFVPVPAVQSGNNTLTYNVGTNPSGIALNVNTNMIYVADTNNNTLSVIDGNSKQVVNRIAVWNGPLSVGVNTVTNTVYAATTSQMTVIEGSTDKVVGKIPAGHTSSNFPVDSKTNRIYTLGSITYDVQNATNSENNGGNQTLVSGMAIYIIDGITNKLEGTIPVEKGAWGLALNDETNRLYVCNRLSSAQSIQNGTLSVIDTVSHNLLATMQVGAEPFAAVVNTKSDTIYVSNSEGDSVSVINGLTNQLVTTIKVGQRPLVIAVDNTRDLVYVANSMSGTVSVIDGHNNTVIADLLAGEAPYDIAFNEKTNTIYVTNWNTDTVLAIDRNNIVG